MVDTDQNFLGNWSQLHKVKILQTVGDILVNFGYCCPKCLSVSLFCPLTIVLVLNCNIAILNKRLFVEVICGWIFLMTWVPPGLITTWRNILDQKVLYRNQKSNLIVTCLFLGFIILCFLILIVTCTSNRNHYHLSQWQWIDGKCDHNIIQYESQTVSIWLLCKKREEIKWGSKKLKLEKGRNEMLKLAEGGWCNVSGKEDAFLIFF